MAIVPDEQKQADQKSAFTPVNPRHNEGSSTNAPPAYTTFNDAARGMSSGYDPARYQREQEERRKAYYASQGGRQSTMKRFFTALLVAVVIYLLSGMFIRSIVDLATHGRSHWVSNGST